MTRELTLQAALYVVRHMRANDRLCVEALIGEITDEEFAINRFQAYGPAWTILQDGEPVAIGGVTFGNDWIGVLWMLTTDRIDGQSWRKLIRLGRNIIANAMDPTNQHHKRRIEAHVLKGWDAAERFASHMGLQYEGTRRCAGYRGEDFETWAIVKD